MRSGAEAAGEYDPVDQVNAAKRELRARLLRARAAMPAEYLVTASYALRDALLAAPEVSAALTVTLYVSFGTEPGTGPLLAALSARRTRVLLPVLRPDLDLDWAPYEGEDSLGTTPRGLREPVTPRLGVDAVSAADAVLLPGLAVDRQGHRLGRGGGSYDRALVRVDGSTFTAVLLYDGEVIDAIPAARHDRTVRAAATPSGLERLG